jgi:hypothetical protein
MILTNGLIIKEELSMEFLVIIILVGIFVWWLYAKKKTSSTPMSKEPEKTEYEIAATKSTTVAPEIHTESTVVKDDSVEEDKEDLDTIPSVPVKENPYKDIRFRVAGVTKTNENKKQIQPLLKRIANGYKKEEQLDSFDGYTNKEMIEYMIEGTEFEGQYLRNVVEFVPEKENPYDEHAIKVYLEDVEGQKHHIGYVGKDINQRVNKVLAANEIEYTEAEFTGGKQKSIEYDVMEDKEHVEVEELTRGLHINIYYK